MEKRVLVGVLLLSAAIVFLSFEAAAPAPSNRQTIRLERIGVAFDVPKGFVVLQTDNVHHIWHTFITFGREHRPGHLRYAFMRLVFWPGAYDGRQTITGYKPSEYVEVEYREVMEGFRQGVEGYVREPEYIKLFGNKAVRYTVGGLGTETVILGFLRQDQLPSRMRPFTEEYLIRIDFSWDFPAEERQLYTTLLDTVVTSLRFTR